MTATPNPNRVHDWEMLSAFSLVLPKDASAQEDCPLKPVMEELKPFGLEETLLRQICHEVMQAGEELRTCCPEGRLDCVNVRVYLSTQVLRGKVDRELPWKYYLTRQMASSESDNLEAFEHPNCFVDVFVDK